MPSAGNGDMLFLPMDETAKSSEQMIIEAVECGDRERLQSLLDQGVGIETRDSEGRTLLTIAVRGGDIELCRQLLENRADFTVQDPAGDSLLHVAAKHSDPALLELLIDSGLNVDTPNNFGTTVLVQAVLQSNRAAARKLLEFGADPLKKNGEHHALFYSCDLEDVETFQMIVDSQSDRSRFDKEIPLLYCLAVARADSAFLERLHRNFNVDPDHLFSAAEDFKFLLHRLYRKGQNQEYLARFIQVESTEDYEIPVLAWAAAFGNVEILDNLLKQQLTVDIPLPPQGCTPLMWAAVAGHQDAVDSLLRAGADPRIKDHKRRTILDLVETYGYFFSHRLILKRLRSH